MMEMKRFLRRAAALWTAAVLFSVAVGAEAAPSAKEVILIDGHTSRVILSHNADTPALIASTTKIMTGLLIAERCSLDEPVTVPPEAVGVEGSSLHLQAGEVRQVRELLYGLMLHSGNDAAVALAIHCAGSVEQFVALMNRRAESLGMTGTHFANPHGLDHEEHHGTARDLAILTAEAMKNDTFHTIVSTKTVTLGGRTYTNHNKLLWRYDGAVGVKTGYTKEAGRILVSCAERGNRRLIAVTIDDPNDWEDHASMLDHGFSQFTSRTIAQAGTVLGVVPVAGGQRSACGVTVCEDVTVSLAPGERVKLTVELPPFSFAPMEVGAQAGWLQVEVDDAAVLRVPLVWKDTVREA